jgi:hypothetical protein
MRIYPRHQFIIALVMLGMAPALAAEPSGCENFKWPVARERAALTVPDRPALASGAELSTLPPTSVVLSLRPTEDAALQPPPERAPKPGGFAGFLRFKSLPQPGVYTVSLSAAAWIDVVQDEHLLKPVGFSGATDCDGIRKVVHYEFVAGPLLPKISGNTSDSIAVAVLPAD